jgi:hypothetical protein
MQSAQSVRARLCAVIMAALALAAASPAADIKAAGAQQSDLDALMQRVMARRDDNWQKLQQYVLDERETIELRGPDRSVMWGERREYTWYKGDDRFVRSPLRFNGVEIGEADRRKYEADFVRREQEREKRRAEGTEIDQEPAPASPGEPQFVSSAYFLRFKFESGKYALVGREALEGRQVLRIEYYPTQLFKETQSRTDRPERADRRRRAEQAEPLQKEVQRVLNKAALVTLWIDQDNAQILKYTFDNVGSGLSALSISVNALPLGWLAQVEQLRASMTMGEAFPDVWLPRNQEMRFTVGMAVGQFEVQYALDYHDYRRADVTSTIRIPEPR